MGAILVCISFHTQVRHSLQILRHNFMVNRQILLGHCVFKTFEKQTVEQQTTGKSPLTQQMKRSVETILKQAQRTVMTVQITGWGVILDANLEPPQGLNALIMGSLVIAGEFSSLPQEQNRQILVYILTSLLLEKLWNQKMEVVFRSNFQGVL